MAKWQKMVAFKKLYDKYHLKRAKAKEDRKESWIYVSFNWTASPFALERWAALSLTLDNLPKASSIPLAFRLCLDCCPSSWAHLWGYELLTTRFFAVFHVFMSKSSRTHPCLSNSWSSSMGFQSWLMAMSWFQFHWRLSLCGVSTQEPISLKLFVQVSRRFLKVKPKRLCLKGFTYADTMRIIILPQAVRVLSCRHWPTKWLTWLRTLLQLPLFLGLISCSLLSLGLMIPLTMCRPSLGLPSLLYHVFPSSYLGTS